MAASDQRRSSRGVPVLIIAFNRPDLLERTLAAVRDARPTTLYAFCDGPRSAVPGDEVLVTRTRALLRDGVDWDCEVHLRFADTNLGCRLGPSTAISWFFDHVEEGIILEDDCVPGPEFFVFAEQMLERYRGTTQVMSVSGSNPTGIRPSDRDASYCFTRQPIPWGWATWRRAWRKCDLELEAWRQLRTDRAALKELWSDGAERLWYWLVLDRLARRDLLDVWDYQWDLSVTLDRGLCVLPAVNLITNTGFRADATHTVRHNRRVADAAAQRILPLVHPEAIVADARAEAAIFRDVRCGRYGRAASILAALVRRYDPRA